MDEGRTLDPEQVPNVPLHPVLHHQVLAAEDVGDPELDVIDGPGELEHRPHRVPVSDPGMVEVADPEQDAVAERRVRVLKVGLEPEDRLARPVGVREHSLPLPERLVRGLGPLRTRDAVSSVIAQQLGGAAADVRTPLFDHASSPGIERRDPVRLVVNRVRMDARRIAVAPDEVEELGLHPLLLRANGVVEDEEDAAAVPLAVQLVQEEHPSVPDVQHSARKRGEAEHDVARHGPGEVGKFRPAGTRLPRPRGLRTPERDQSVLEFGRRQGADLGDDPRRELPDLSGLGPEPRLGSEEPGDDRIDPGGAGVRDRVLQREPPDAGLHLGR